MPHVQISSNVSKANVDIGAAIAAVTKIVSVVLDRAASQDIVQMQFDLLISLQESQAVDDERNPKTVAALTETVAEQLNVSPERVSIYLEDILAESWAVNGKTTDYRTWHMLQAPINTAYCKRWILNFHLIAKSGGVTSMITTLDGSSIFKR